MKRIAILFYLFVLVSSCKELEEPISTASEPMFYLKGKLNIDSLTFVAGDSSYYHYTTHQKDINSIYEFSSEFKRQDCENCDDKIKITIRAQEKSVGNTISIMDALSFGSYEYIENVELPRHRFIKFELDTALNPVGSSTFFEWDFGDGNISREKNPVHYFNSDGEFSVKLDYSNPSCSGSVVKVVAIQSDTLDPKCKIEFKTSVVNQTEVLFYNVDSSSSSNFFWDFGDGNTSNEMTPIHNYAAVGSYLVKLTVNRIALGCQASMSKVLDLAQLNCPLSFNYGFTNPPSFDTLNYSKVLVEYTNSSGDYFRSDKITQIIPEFYINSIEPYENNERNEKTVKFNLNFTCDLMNQTGQTIKLNSIKGKVGVSYP